MESFVCAKQALDMLRELGNKKLQGDCLMQMGESCAQSLQGLAHFEQCLVIRREVSDLVGEAKCLQVVSRWQLTRSLLQALGGLQSYLGNSRASAKCWQDCLSLKRELQDDGGVKTCLQQLCAIFTNLEDYLRVSDYVNQLRDMAQSEHDADSEVQALTMSARCHLNLGSLQAAESTYKAALRICQEHAQSEQLLVREAECHDNLARVYQQQDRHAEAKKEQEQVTRLKKKLGKDMLRGVVGASDKSIKRKIFSLR